MKSKNIATAVALAAAIMVPGIIRAATWSGAGDSLLWSNPQNWTPVAPPGWDVMYFNNPGATNAPGLVNNVVAADLTISNLTSQAFASHIALSSNYHTTFINSGVTLAIDRGDVGGSMIYVGHTTDTSNYDPQYFYTIKGPGSLIAGNQEAPFNNQGLQVTSVNRTYTNHYGSLDMSGLDNFSLSGGYFWVGINGGEGTALTDRPAGQVLLAKTNKIVMVGDTYDLLNLGSFRVGESRGNTCYLPSLLELGQENTIYTPWFKIGGARTGNGLATDGRLSGGYMRFRSGLVNPTLTLRGSDGVSRLGTMRIGDNSWTTGGTIGSAGFVDLSGGKVDAYVNELYVGRGPGGNSTSNPGAAAYAAGTLTWNDGTFDVLTMLVGYQYGNNPTTNRGTVNVLTPNAKLRADRLVLGRDAGANAGGGTGLLNIDGGTVEITTYLSESPGTGGNGKGTVILTNQGVLNLQPAGDTLPAVATLSSLEYSSGTVTNGTLALGKLNVYAPATEFTAYPGTALTAGTSGGVGTMAVTGNLKLAGGEITADVDTASALDQVNVSGSLTLSGISSVSLNPLNTSALGANTYTVATAGTISGTPANLKTGGSLADSRYTATFDLSANRIDVTLSGAGKYLVWSGGNNGNAWDLKNTANWNSGADQFYAFDPVEFGDTGSASPAVNMQGALIPGGVTFSASSKDYTLAGSGKISGLFGVTLTGGSTVTILTTNDYKGTTDINAGTLVLGNGATADGALGSGAINNYGTLVFNPAVTQVVSPVISGSGNVIKRGSGLTKLSGANTFTGFLTNEAGILQAGNAGALGDAGFYAAINSGATLDLGGFTLNKPIIVSGAGVNGAGAIVNTGSAQALRDVQLVGDTVFGGATAWSVSSSAANSSEPGLTAYGYKITKVSTNLVTVYGQRSLAWDLDLGEVDITAGVFAIRGSVGLGSQTSKAITVRTNATLELGVNSDVVLTKTYVFDNGSCVFLQNTNSFMDGSIALGGRVVFDVLNTRTLTLNCPVTGGDLVKGIGSHPATATSTGNGTLVLNGANTVTGFHLETGTVSLNEGASISASELALAGGTLVVTQRTDSTLTLNGGQTLSGRGTVNGTVSSPNGTFIVPQQTNGILTVTGDMTLRGKTTMDLCRIGSVVTNSSLKVTGVLDCGGSLTLTSSGEALRAGDTFKLFTAATLNNPFQSAAITWPALSSGLYWTNRIATDGTVAVASVEPTAPPVLSAVYADGSLSLSWPIDYVSYILQAQTNTTAAGLSGNWYPVSGVSGNQITFPVDQNNPSVFYRLISTQ